MRIHSHHNTLLIAILVAAITGIIAGWYFGPAMLAVSWLGTMFLNALKMMIIPLIIAAVISGVTSMGDIRKLGYTGGLTILYYTSTTAIAVLVGMIIVNIIQPGSGITEISQTVPDKVTTVENKGFTNIILSIVTPNLIASAGQLELLPIIIFCLLFAAALTTIGEQGQPLVNFFNGLNEVMMKLINWVMYFAPIGIFCLIASRMGAAGGGAVFWNEIVTVGLYCVTVILGLFIHFCILIGILHVFSHYNLAYLKQMMQALIMAFGTASSSATLPITIKCATAAGINKKSIKFVLPLGATVNMDGTALYEAVAVMFIAQAYGYDMSLTEQTVIFITATLAAIGAAGIPQAGLVTMVIVLTAVDLPLEGIGLLLAVDWFLDRFRTAVNVWGDATGTAIIERTVNN